MSIYIPHALLLALVWTAFAFVALIVVTSLVMVSNWCIAKISEGFRVVMAFCGLWAAFWNYIQIKQLLVDGGGYFQDYLRPKEPFGLTWSEERKKLFDAKVDHMSVDMLFEVVPHPEAWQPWMRLIGYKKPKAVDTKQEQA